MQCTFSSTNVLLVSIILMTLKWNDCDSVTISLLRLMSKELVERFGRSMVTKMLNELTTEYSNVDGQDLREASDLKLITNRRDVRLHHFDPQVLPAAVPVDQNELQQEPPNVDHSQGNSKTFALRLGN